MLLAIERVELHEADLRPPGPANVGDEGLRRHVIAEIDKVDASYARSLLALEQTDVRTTALSRADVARLHAHMTALQNFCARNFACVVEFLRAHETATQRSVRAAASP